jgi:hypothetical protein
VSLQKKGVGMCEKAFLVADKHSDLRMYLIADSSNAAHCVLSRDTNGFQSSDAIIFTYLISLNHLLSQF